MGQDFYPDIVVILKEHGYVYVATRGSHEKWRNPATGKTVTVPKTSKSRHTFNAVLKQAGIDKKL
ncbi:MAG: type II toxin-antitoxin system HicA family toxin [Alphaproteobacteria bacterium]